MDLKFTFGGASPDHHDHGDAPSGIPLPFTAAPGLSTSSVLEVRARLDGGEVVGEAVSGDGVAYATGSAPIRGKGSAALARAVRSALSRAVAGLEGPLAESLSAVVLDLGGAEAAVLDELGIARDPSQSPQAAVDAALQRRIGVAAGTPIRVGS